MGKREGRLGPETDDSHDAGSEVNGEEEGRFALPVVSTEHGIAVHLEGDKLDVGVVEKDTSRERVEDALDEESLEAVRLEGLADSDTNGDTDGGGERVKACSQELLPGVEALHLSNTHTKGDTFEKLMENDRDQQALELVSGNSKSETDDNRVEETGKRGDWG